MYRILSIIAASETRDPFGGNLLHLMARETLSDEFKRKMLYDNLVRFLCFNEGDIAAAKKAREN